MCRFIIFILGLFLEVELKAESFNKDNIEKCIRSEVLQLLQTNDFILKIHSWNPKWEKEGNESLQVTSIEYYNDNKRFKASVSYGASSKKLIIGDIIRKIQLPVSKVVLSGHTSINLSAFELHDFEESQLTGADIVVDLNELKGLKVRQGRIIKPNIPLRKSDFERPVVVKKGEQVRIIFIDPSFEVSTVAFASDNGAVGDKITFEVAGKKFVQATIVHEGRAEIRNTL